MEFGHYTARSAATAAALVNAMPPAGFATPPVDLLPPGVVPDDAAARLTALARQLRRAFAASDEAEATAVINDLLRDLPLRPHLSRHDGKPAHLHVAPATADPVTRLACNTAMAVATIAGEHGHHRLCVCAAPDCATAFVDTSRNGRRRFCGPGCANRAHVRAHRSRAAAGHDAVGSRTNLARGDGVQGDTGTQH